MRQIIVFFLGVLMMTGCASQATFGDAITEGEPTPIPTPIVPEKPIYQVERGDIIYEQRYLGRITPAISQELAFTMDGRLLEAYFATGDQVVTGDVLANLDTSDLEAQLLDAEEQLAIAQSIFDSATNQVEFGKQRAQLNLNLAQLRLDYAISQAGDPQTEHDLFLIETRTIERDLSQLELDELQDGVDPELRFDVTRAQKQVDEIQALMAQAQLVATMDGQLMSFTVSTGDPVNAFETVAVIANMSKLELSDDMDSNELSELTEGMPVTIARANSPGDVYEGTIIALPEPYGTGVDELTHVQFDTDISDSDLSVGDRMSFTAVVDQREDVLWLPSSAIRQFSGREFVVIQNDSLQQRVDVKLGLEGDGRVEILEGVEENQTVIGP